MEKKNNTINASEVSDQGKTGGDKPKSDKLKKIKCYHCKKKVGMIILNCKCGHIFCQSHLNAHSHNCTYDYKKEKKETLEKNNPKLGQKMVKI